MHAVGNKFALFKERGHAIKYVIACAFDIARSLLLKRLHVVDVHGARTGDEVAFVVVFSAERKGDQVAAVVKDSLVDKVVAALVPPAGIHVRDVLAWPGGQRFWPQAGKGGSAPVEVIKPRELGKRAGLCSRDFF